MAEWWNSVRLRVRALLRRGAFERDLDDELAFHLASREEQLRRSGAEAPRAAARRRFGSPVSIRQDLHAAWALAPRTSALLRDLRYAARILRRARAFTVVVVLTIGLGIGANTAFFSVVNAVLVRPLGYPDPDRLVSVSEGFPDARIDRLPFSALDFDDLRAQQQSFESVGAFRLVGFELLGTASQRVTGARVSADLFPTLGVAPVAGRTFSAEEDRPGVHVTVLSWGLWQRQFGADRGIVGRSIQLDRQSYTVVGIMPEGFVFPPRGPVFNGQPADVWIPMAFTDRERFERGSLHNNSVVARLRPGLSIDAARAELEVLATRIATSYPPAARQARFTPRLFVQPLRDEIAGRVRTPLLLLLSAVGLVLLVACANVATLFLSRAAGRTREFALRTLLGAGRRQIVQLLLCEALLLSLVGGTVGLALAFAAIKAAPVALTGALPGLHALAIDWRVLAFTVAACVGTALVVGLAPLLTLDRRNPGGALRDEPTRTTPARRTVRLQGVFVVAAVTLACVLLAGAGLLARSFAALIGADLGFRPAEVIAASMTLPRSFYATGPSVRAFHDQLSRELAELPGVRSVGLATNPPFTSHDTRAFTAEHPSAGDGAATTTKLTWVHGPYLETIGVTLRRGRHFTPDEYVQARRVVIVNEKLAAVVWPGQDAVGKRLKLGGRGSAAPWLTVVGVIASVADGPAGAEPGVHAYEPFAQLQNFFLINSPTQFGREITAAMRASDAPASLPALVRDAVARLDRQLAIQRIETLDDRVGEIRAPQRFGALLVGIFATIAVLLAAVGLYGLLAFTTAQRRKEIAIRIAFGAERRSTIGLVIAHGARLVAVGFVAGLAGSLAFTRFLSSLLYQSDPYDPVTFAVVPAVLIPVALLACAIPAWRASRVEPIAALRTD